MGDTGGFNLGLHYDLTRMKVLLNAIATFLFLSFTLTMITVSIVFIIEVLVKYGVIPR